MKHIIVGLFVVVTAACATSGEEREHTISCPAEEPNWDGCLRKASSLCGKGGYEVLERNANYWGSEVTNRSLIVKCKK